MVGERRLRPALHDDLVGLVEVGPIALLVLDGGAIGPPEFPSRGAGSRGHAELEPPATDHVEHGRLLGDPDRMLPGEDVRHLAEADALRLGRDRRLRQQRVGAELRPFGLEVVLGHEPVVKAEPIGQNALPHLTNKDALIALVHLFQGAIIDHHTGRGGHGSSGQKRHCERCRSRSWCPPFLSHG